MSARVSVVVRTKDRPLFLARAIEDVLAQTFTSWELVIANDGGDPSAVRAVVDRYSDALADRALVIDVERPGGRCAAANQGIRAGTGEYVVLHDDDDLWHPSFLARTVATLDGRPHDAGVMTATAIVFEELHAGAWVETGRVPFWEGLTGVSFTSLLEVNRAVPISFLYRRAVHDEVGWYDESLDTVEDWDLYLRITQRHPIAFLGGEPLAFWTQRPKATGSDANSMFEISQLHERDDLAVRDAALRAWVAENGPGLPLYIALVEKQLSARIDALRADIIRELDVHHPVTTALRRLRRTLRARRSGSAN